jgi:hypothetical protein
VYSGPTKVCFEHRAVSKSSGKGKKGKNEWRRKVETYRVCDNSFPALLLGLLSCGDDLEHFLLADATDFGEGHAESRCLFSPLVFDRGT